MAETLWMLSAHQYHSITEEGREEKVYHAGGWLCPRGGRILVRHLMPGTGEDRTLCEECAEELDHRKQD